MPPTTTNTTILGRGSIYERSVRHQPQSPLLRLPAELRLEICSNMSLSPTTVDWNGAFFSCLQLHNDMLTKLHSKQEAIKYMKVPSCLNFRGAHPVFGWIRNMYLIIELNLGWRDHLHAFKKLYTLHLDDLQFLLIGEPRLGERYPGIATPYGDLTTLGPPGLATPSGQLEPAGTNVVINCKKITLTLDHLANVEGARDKQTCYEVAFQGTDIMYLFTVVQNKQGQQVERSYTLDTRFEMPTPLPPQDEEEDEYDKCANKRGDDTCGDCAEGIDELQQTLCAIL
ncbi:uncharacterized protein M421DRAFT_157853 [Didymella exigua CBS 183.55]|uniref:Uncharacterized protein n=1 Tax=Didymella exigua CBS 183.55 TaxID=1150837 RepID=A0A6A5RS13_9PLEO|nr:uncharacterized protein M421DRAFT_157853 [Didymella exigua CBS 183.55]KAF1928287.1 hypothetical protein M421DRAFT_157853 [Didymella exigua CBS 183.55]